jgi:hypothetical protein
MQVQVLGRVAVDGFEEAQELLVTVPRHAFAYDAQPCEQSKAASSRDEAINGDRCSEAGATATQQDERQ